LIIPKPLKIKDLDTSDVVKHLESRLELYYAGLTYDLNHKISRVLYEKPPSHTSNLKDDIIF